MQNLGRITAKNSSLDSLGIGEGIERACWALAQNIVITTVPCLGKDLFIFVEDV